MGRGAWANGSASRRRTRRADRSRIRPRLEGCEPRVLLSLFEGFQLSIDNPTVVEGNEGDPGVTTLTFRVTLDQPNLEDSVRVHYRTIDDTARDGIDYSGREGDLLFLPDDVAATIDVPVIRNPFHQSDRTLRVVLSDASGAELTTGGGLGTILDDDPLPTLTIDSPSILEGDSGQRQMVFTVRLTPASIEQTVAVHYQTQDGTAQDGLDYLARGGDLVFEPDQVEQTIVIPILGDRLDELDETFTVLLSNPVNAVIAGQQDPGSFVAAESPGLGTILDDDSPPTISIAPATVVEGDGGFRSASFVVTLSAPSGLPVAFHERTIAETATEGTGEDPTGADYLGAGAFLTLEPGTTELTIEVPIVGDTLVESDETFRVELSDPLNATIATGTATGTIRDDDQPGPPTGGFEFGPDAGAAESAGSVRVRVVRSPGFIGPGTVQYETIALTATPGTDFTPVSGSLAFGPTQESAEIEIPIRPDFRIEDNETFLLRLTGAPLGPRSEVLVTIVNDDDTIVTNTNDAGPGSLRNALLVSNETPGVDPILFRLPGPGPYRIAPRSALPNILDPLVLDATPLAAPDGTPTVILDGTDAGANVPGLTLLAGQSTIKGLQIVAFPGSAILIRGAGGNLISGNVLGLPGRGNGQDGLTILDSPDNRAGLPGTGNIITGNAGYGVRIAGAASRGNMVAGNAIGTNPSGTAAGNQAGGLLIADAPGNSLAGNLISASGGPGVQITGPGASGNRLLSNRIGADANLPLGNAFDGVFLDNAPGNIIGLPGSGNLISGNGLVGIRLAGPGATGNLIQANRIGTDAGGTVAVGNRYDGVFLHSGAARNTLGGADLGAGNLISANGSVGVQIYQPESRGNLVLGNRIGTDAAGVAPLGNRRDGVFVNDSPGNAIGLPGAGNLISANGSVGVQLFGSGATGNAVQANRIGTDAAGAPRLGNAYGLFLNAAPGNVVGGPGPAANLIAGNRIANSITDNGRGGPVVTAADARPEGDSIRTITLTFSMAMDPARAGDVNRYRLTTGTARRGLASIRSAVALASATYDPFRRTVTLTLAQPLPAGTPLRLRLDGTGRDGLRDSAGRLLDGNADGRPGGDAQLTLGPDGTLVLARARQPIGGPRALRAAGHRFARRSRG